MNRSELIAALREAAERQIEATAWNYDHIDVVAHEVAAGSLRAVADILAEGVGNEA